MTYSYFYFPSYVQVKVYYTHPFIGSFELGLGLVAVSTNRFQRLTGQSTTDIEVQSIRPQAPQGEWPYRATFYRIRVTISNGKENALNMSLKF